MKPFIMSVAALIMLVGCSKVQPESEGIRLYALNCGDISMDMSAFSRDGAFEGAHGDLANPCFLIRHPKGDLLWDTGFEESLVDEPNGIGDRAFHKSMKQRLSAQLSQLGLMIDDLEYVALSHSHPDHAGNANLFVNSTFLIQEQEYAFMFSPERRKDTSQFQYFSDMEHAVVETYDVKRDVFGDGRVIIHFTPGHTPGHSVLLLKLDTSGALLFSGDLYIQSKGRKLRSIATFNTNAEQTRASMDKVETLAKAEDARVIIQHDKAVFDTLPLFPAYLD